MPVVCLGRGECPGEGCPSDPRLRVKVVGDIDIIIVANKGMEISRTVDGNSGGKKQARDNDLFSVGKSGQRLPLQMAVKSTRQKYQKMGAGLVVRSDVRQIR